MGFILAVIVHSAGIQDRDGALLLLDESKKEQYPRMEVIFSDAGYSGKCAEKINERLGWQVEVVQKKEEIWLKEPSIETKKVFEVLKWRWIVERTFAWLGRSRRLSKDYEQYENTSETWIFIAMSQLMLRRLT